MGCWVDWACKASRKNLISPIPGCGVSSSIRAPIGQPLPGNSASSVEKPVVTVGPARVPNCDPRQSAGCSLRREAEDAEAQIGEDSGIDMAEDRQIILCKYTVLFAFCNSPESFNYCSTKLDIQILSLQNVAKKYPRLSQNITKLRSYWLKNQPASCCRPPLVRGRHTVFHKTRRSPDDVAK